MGKSKSRKRTRSDYEGEDLQVTVDSLSAQLAAKDKELRAKDKEILRLQKINRDIFLQVS